MIAQARRAGYGFSPLSDSGLWSIVFDKQNILAFWVRLYIIVDRWAYRYFGKANQ